MNTNDVHQSNTQGDGTFQFNNLIPGTYQIAVISPGFKTYVEQNLVLKAQIASTVNVMLEVGGTQERVEVVASAALVDTQTANTSATMESRLIQDLPNGTRNPLNFVFALAGTTAPPSGMSGKFQVLDQMASNFGMNGGRTGSASILIDGAPSQAVDWGGMLITPLQDSVQEQQVVTNTYDAQFQRSGSGVVTLITRGGAAQYHGEGFDFLQKDVFNANGWANNKYSVPRGEFMQNQFGGNVSGPLLKRWNMFFFGAYEGLRQPFTSNSGAMSVPTQAERSGDFSQSRIVDPNNPSSTIPVMIYNPFSTTAVTDATGNIIGYTRTPFDWNKIPTSLINSTGQMIANLYPLPNRDPKIPGTTLENFLKDGSGQTLSDKMDMRVDWAQNSVNRMFFRFSDRFRQGTTYPCYFCNGADSNNNSTSSGWLAVLNDTITPSPTWVINSLVSYGYWLEQQRLVGFGQATASTIGLDPTLFQAPTLPMITADGYAQLSNSQDFADIHYARTSSTAQVNVTKEFSKHTLKFGGNFDVQMISNFKNMTGQFNFSTAMTSCDPQASGPCLANNTTSNLTGNGLASELLGTASGGGQAIGISPAMSIKIFGGYIQDQWRITPRLTINAGLRYENQRPVTERYDRMMYFDPNAPNPIAAQVEPLLGRPITGAFGYVNSNDRYGWPADNTNFAPRMGIAYRVTDKLVMRAGAGMFYLPATAMISFDNPGQFYGYASSTPYIGTTDNGFIPNNLVSNPFPNGINQPTGSSLGASTLLGDGLGQIWLKGPHPTPYSIQWSFGLQYQLAPHSVIEAGYTGVRGRKLLYGNPNLDGDQLDPKYLSLGAQLDAPVTNPFYGIAPASTWLGSQPTVPYNELLRPYPQYTYLQWTRSLPGAHSQFDALNVKYTHTFSAGLSLLATYQWSKALDNGPEDYFGWGTGNQWRDAYNTNLDYNISTHDIPQSFATALVYELPYGKGKRWGGDAPAAVKAVLGGWQVSSGLRFASGLPLYQIFWAYGNHLGNYGFPGWVQIADWAGTPSTTGNPDAWISPGTFQAPPSEFMYGNAAQRYTQLRQRTEQNVDFAVAKTFPFTERFRGQFRWEFFNLFNYAQYNLGAEWRRCVTCGGFGQMDSIANFPRMMQVSMKLLF
jgi:hypothetical protein